MRIFLTNDDGIQAPGLLALYHALRDAGHDVQVVAPMMEQSAVGHAITVRAPLQIREVIAADFQGVAVSGTPADCVKLGLSELAPVKPDLVVSGINSGANVGPDIMYSGTVAAAREGASQGFPALAVSYNSFAPADLTEQARYTAGCIARIPWADIPRQRVINLNFPAIPLRETKGVRLCPQTSAVWRDWYERGDDPRGRPFWWLNGDIPEDQVEAETDWALLHAGYITLTPLRFDFTDAACLDALRPVFS